MEEVGFDMKDRAFDDQYLERDLNGQLIRLYIVKQVPLDTKFAAKTKNEIKVIDFSYLICYIKCILSF
jgi:mRNA-decapping enzyme subunit 2